VDQFENHPRPESKIEVLLLQMIKIAETRREKRDVALYWENARREASRIRDEYEREKDARERRKLNGTRSYVDSVILYTVRP
jgi:hypothetical protein